MFKNIYKHAFTIFLVLFCGLISLRVLSTPPSQPLTAPLPAVFSNERIPEDFLINLSTSTENNFSFVWLDNEHFIYDLNGKIETFDITNRTKTSLGKGSSPKISPNGEWIAFIDAEEGIAQIWLMRKDGSDRKQLTHLKNGLVGAYGYHYDFTWSLDSSQLAFYINPFNPDQSINAARLNISSTLNVVDVTTGVVKEVYSDRALLDDLSWFPNGEKLLFTNLHTEFLHDEDDITCVQSVRLRDGHVDTWAKFDGLQQRLNPKISPDGLQVSLLYCAESDIYDWMPGIGIVDVSQETNEAVPRIKQLTFDLKFHHAKWSKNGRYLFALRNYGAYNQIYRVDVKSGEMKQLTNAPLNIHDFELSPDGLKLAWKGMDAHGSRFVRIALIDGSQVQDLIIEPGFNGRSALSEVQEIEWDTHDYPSKMRGLLFLPLNYKEGTRYPLVVDIHGGGAGANIHLAGGILTDSPLEWQLWTAKGYAVFVPEFRSSAAFGFLAISRDDLQENNIIDCDMIDILAGLDELVKRGIVDNNRVAAIGHSAGGRRANWLTTATDRFQVIISKEGWVDERAVAMKFPRIWKQFGGSPLEVPENYTKNSSFFHIKNASTPTLFLMGNPDLGGTDFDKSVYKLYEALKEHGVETEHVEYLDEGHNFMLPKNRRDALKRTMEWIDRYTSIEAEMVKRN